MKSIFSRLFNRTRMPAFPILLEHKETGTVALFTAPNTAVRMSVGDPRRSTIPLYESGDYWESADSGNWVPYTGTVTLSN